MTDRVELSPRARRFLHASVLVDRRRRRRATTVLSILLVVAVVAAGVAVNRQRAAELQQRAAQLQQRIATAHGLVVQADAVRGNDPRTALLLGVAAEAIHPDGETKAGLVNTLIGTRWAATLTGYSDAVTEVAFSPDGRTLATATPATVVLWDVADPVRPRRLGQALPGLRGPVEALGFAPGGRTLATSSADTVVLWDVADPVRPRRLGRPLAGHSAWVSTLAFAPDGRTLASGSYDQTVVLWDLADSGRPRRLGQPLTGHRLAAFAPRGHTLATGSLDSVVLWDLTDRSRPRRLGQPLHSGLRTFPGIFTREFLPPAPAFAPNGDALAAAADRAVVLWDVANPTRPRRLGQPLSGHASRVTSVAFAPDGRTLVTASSDRTVVLWDLAELDDLRRHALQRACSYNGRALTRDEWARHVPGLPYQRTCPG